MALAARPGQIPIMRLGFRATVAHVRRGGDKAQTSVCAISYSDEAAPRRRGRLPVGRTRDVVEPATAKLMAEKNVIATLTIIAYESQKTEEKPCGSIPPFFAARLRHPKAPLA